MELKFSKPMLDGATWSPFINIECKTKLSLDREMYTTLRIYDESVINVMVAEYRQALEKQLGKELEKYEIKI